LGIAIDVKSRPANGLDFLKTQSKTKSTELRGAVGKTKLLYFSKLV